MLRGPLANNSLALNLVIEARESEKEGFWLWDSSYWGGWKNNYIPDKSRGWARKSKQLLLITQPTILVSNNGPGLGRNKSFVNDIQSYKNSQLG